MLVRGDAAPSARALPGLEVLPLDVLRGGAPAPPAPPNGEGDLAMLLFTSGTTGRSKGCMLTHRYGPRQAQLMIEHYGLREDDVLYSPFPLFHLDALVLTVLAALELGATAAIGTRFSLSGFWAEIRAFGATVFDFMGATLSCCTRRRRGRTTATTRSGSPGASPCPLGRPSSRRASACASSSCTARPTRASRSTSRSTRRACPARAGVRSPAYDVRLLGEDGREVADGTAGEIAVRPREPGLANTGYYGMPEATAAAWRDGWFLTGDLATRDADGNLFFVGRRKDVIRRRGENISGLRGRGGRPGPSRRPGRGRLRRAERADRGGRDGRRRPAPRPARRPGGARRALRRADGGYMTPRYVDVVDALPVTPTEKVEKYRLIERGVTPTTWDREA